MVQLLLHGLLYSIAWRPYPFHNMLFFSYVRRSRRICLMYVPIEILVNLLFVHWVAWFGTPTLLNGLLNIRRSTFAAS